MRPRPALPGAALRPGDIVGTVTTPTTDALAPVANVHHIRCGRVFLPRARLPTPTPHSGRIPR